MATSTCAARRHGTYSAYRNYGCKCPDALRAYNRRRKQLVVGIAEPLRVDPTGTRRRVQALMALGWPSRTVFTQAGMSDSMHIYRHPTVHIETANRIRDVYDRLSMTPGPSIRSRNLARKAGYPPPLAWDDDTIDDPKAAPCLGVPVEVDEVAVRRALTGDRPVEMNRREIVTAIEQGHANGLTFSQIAVLLSMKTDTVQMIHKRQQRESQRRTA